jgi:hypothetical protein
MIVVKESCVIDVWGITTWSGIIKVKRLCGALFSCAKLLDFECRGQQLLLSR